ncbi:protein translocase SEC61 complex subunit gamma [Halorussus halophilus]|uniref:protein translocase SEC61 complex subunit gamma n=1 Tax=Halorussus halophilus TaxID=2650975 RepID=UPI0013019237|nr:protein translocase SEC61 complex subunit gamma [Halorussus halophilus]
MDVKFELSSYVRVLKLASTPSFDEFSKISTIAGAGIALIGVLGFIIAAIMSFIPT